CERNRREREETTHQFMLSNGVSVYLCLKDGGEYYNGHQKVFYTFRGDETFLWESGLIPQDVSPEHLRAVCVRRKLELIFDRDGDGYILNLPQWKIGDRVERARKYANRPKETTPLEKCHKERHAAREFPVEVSDQEEYCCPILLTTGKRAERYWAVLGDKCFPVSYAGASRYSLESLLASPLDLQEVIQGSHASDGYRFVKA